MGPRQFLRGTVVRLMIAPTVLIGLASKAEVHVLLDCVN